MNGINEEMRCELERMKGWWKESNDQQINSAQHRIRERKGENAE